MSVSKPLPSLPYNQHFPNVKAYAGVHELSRLESFDTIGSISKHVSRASTTSSQLDLVQDQANTTVHTPKQKKFHGWRMSVLVCATTAGIVLMSNVMLAMWASTRSGIKEGISIIQDGDCRQTKFLSLWLHLAINVLSTLLLAASNYTMQCLVSPTREEVDRAHERHIWLDIGVPSVRNLRQISWYRIVLWWCLGLSGVPLHLLYNSAVFSSLAAVQYSVYAGSSDLLSGGAALDWSSPIPNVGGKSLQTLQDAAQWKRLNNAECISAYARPFVSSHGDLLTITSDLNGSQPAVAVTDYTIDLSPTGLEVPYEWICQQSSSNYDNCDIDLVLKDWTHWTVQNGSFHNFRYPLANYTVDYCLSKPVVEQCRLQFSIAIMVIVILCNLVKLICMLLTLWFHTSQPLVTLGDAIASFLDEPDKITVNMCLADKDKFIKGDWTPGPNSWQSKRRRWFAGASRARWLTCNILCALTLLITTILLTIGASSRRLTSTSLSHLWALGYGTVTSESMVSWNMGLISTILIANSPQLLLSFLFLTYNSLFTSMLLSAEWLSYSHKRKPLRVTTRVGAQRSTYRLQLPYRYGIPLLIVSGVLHWLVSQSLFLARVSVFDSNGIESPTGSISTIGYSCIAVITVIILGGVVVLLGLLNGARRYRDCMPLVGSCSAAISAACHLPKGEERVMGVPSRRGLMWGVVDRIDKTDANGTEHCCFGPRIVEKVVEGKVYA